jgi:imidazolonepropionase
VPVLRNIGLLARCLPDGAQREIHSIPSAALAWEADRFVWAGPESKIPEEYSNWPSEDAGGNLVIPGLVDCHTHLAFGGWRSEEFEDRVLGRSYQEIARRGGGILSTMRHTREMTIDGLVERCRGFLGEMARLGVTTVECKSGYGLDTRSELMLLETYRALQKVVPQRIVSTLLAAHTVPPEYSDRREEYVKLIIDEIIPEVSRRGLASYCDVFIESGAFSIEEGRRILTAGIAHGLGAKMHADQLSPCGGAELAGELGAVSADHLECVSEAGILALVDGRVVAVSLPLATLYLRQGVLPARRLLEAGVPVAVATDFNPGSAPSFHLPLAMTLACITQGMSPAEVLKGATIVAAAAIGVDVECGSIESGKAADFAIIDAPDVNQWLYHFRSNACVRTVIGGVTVPSAQ